MATARVTTTWNYEDATGAPQQKLIARNDYAYDHGQRRTGNVLSGQVVEQITGQAGTSFREGYTYDKLGQLETVKYYDRAAGGAETLVEDQGYVFDAMRNRSSKKVNGTTQSYTYDGANRLLTRGAITYINDANGNTLTGDGRTNTWDSQNRLAQCVYNGNTSVFTYGADGLRRRSVVNGVTTDYALDGQSVVRELRGSTVHATYLTGVQGPMYRRDASGLRWYVYDGLGSVLAEVDGAGNIQMCRTYDVYGSVRRQDADPNHTSKSSHKFVGALGHMSEGETGYTYMRARYYDPAIGRFISEDPAMDGINWYVYADNNPVSRVDVSGRDTEDMVKGAIIAFFAMYFTKIGDLLLSRAAKMSLAAFGRWIEGMGDRCLKRGWSESAAGALEIGVGASEGMSGGALTMLHGQTIQLQGYMHSTLGVKDIVLGLSLKWAGRFAQAAAE